MTIALFSDVHANLPAFEALLTDLDQRKPDAIYCLGDLIGYNIWPNEIIAEIRKRSIATLAGNHDQKTKGYAYELVAPDNRAFLNTLPALTRLEYQIHNDNLNILLAHGSPRSIDEYMLIDTDERYVRDMMEEFNVHVLCVGHSHKPFHRIVGGRHLINIGSVGKPKDNNPDGCYVLLHISATGEVKPEFIRIRYDVEKAAQAIENSPLPAELADRLRRAY